MGVHSGRFGTVDNVKTVRDWNINDSGTLAEAVASNTAFAKARRPAIEDWTGGFKYYGSLPPVMPGELFPFVGYMAPDNDAGGAGQRYSGNAIASQLIANWNWQNGEILNQQIDFGGHLALASASGAVVLDEEDPDLPIVGGTKIEFSLNDADWEEWTNLLQATFTLTNALQTYVNSSTYVGGRSWTGRKPGNLDWTLAVVEQDVIRSRFNKGDQVALRLYVSGEDFWLLKWGIVKEFTGITVNRETGAIIQQTVNIEMNGVNIDDASLGTITLPDESEWWPVPQT